MVTTVGRRSLYSESLDVGDSKQNLLNSDGDSVIFWIIMH